MKIKTISYGRTYNLTQYNSERIDLQADIEENEDEQAALSILKEKVERFHKENTVIEQPIEETKLTKEEMEANYIAEYNQCTTLEQLQQYRLTKNHSKATFEAYNNKEKQLKP